MSRRRAKIEKLRRLSESPNPHEAARAREAAARLSEGQPDLVAEGPSFVYLGHFDGIPRYRQVMRGPDPAYPHQLPGTFRIPSPLAEGRRSPG